MTILQVLYNKINWIELNLVSGRSTQATSTSSILMTIMAVTRTFTITEPDEPSPNFFFNQPPVQFCLVYHFTFNSCFSSVLKNMFVEIRRVWQYNKTYILVLLFREGLTWCHSRRKSHPCGGVPVPAPTFSFVASITLCKLPSVEGKCSNCSLF